MADTQLGHRSPSPQTTAPPLMTIEDSAKTPHLIEIPRIPDARGNLSFIQRCATGVTFDISRTYWIYDVPADADRHGRALRNTAEVIVPLAGAFDVTLDDGLGGARRYHLDRPYRGLYVPPMRWRVIDNFTTNSVAFVLASTIYDEADYISDYHDFVHEVANSRDSLKTPTPSPAIREHNAEKCVREADIHCISSVDNCRLIDLPRHVHANGSLTVAQNDSISPMKIRRAFYIYDVPADTARGGHSHHNSQQMIIAVGGSFDVTLDDGVQRRTYTLNRPYRALYVTPGIWRTMDNFSSGSVCLVLTDTEYAESDYVRDYDDFRRLTEAKKR